MARIRIVDEWLRSPVSPPTRYRTIMVVAETWGEQRVLMRAFADSDDQTRPTIVLHGAELAVSPAGTDPHGAWGLHVEPPADGRAQELREQLELAARRLAGSRASPPRLLDETPSFERKRTGYWAPGTPRDLPPNARTAFGHEGGYWEPSSVARPVPSPAIPSAAPRPTPVRASLPTVAPQAGYVAPGFGPPPPAPPHPSSSASSSQLRRRRGWTSPVPVRRARETASGFDSGASGLRPAEAGPRPQAQRRRLDSLITRTMPMGFRLTDTERAVLNALGEVPRLTARKVGEIAGVDDGVAWMEALIAKLADHGLDLVAPGDDEHGEPTYLLRR